MFADSACGRGYRRFSNICYLIYNTYFLDSGGGSNNIIRYIYGCIYCIFILYMFFGNGCVYVWKINLALACLVCCSAVLVFLLCVNVWSKVWTFICLFITQNRSNIYFLYCIVWPKFSFVPLLPKELYVILY